MVWFGLVCFLKTGTHYIALFGFDLIVKPSSLHDPSASGSSAGITDMPACLALNEWLLLFCLFFQVFSSICSIGIQQIWERNNESLRPILFPHSDFCLWMLNPACLWLVVSTLRLYSLRPLPVSVPLCVPRVTAVSAGLYSLWMPTLMCPPCSRGLSVHIPQAVATIQTNANNLIALVAGNNK